MLPEKPDTTMLKKKEIVKPVKVKPRVRDVFKKSLENGGNITKAMRDLKYKEGTINNPSNVTETKSWKQLLSELPDEKLMKVLDEGLEASRVISSINPGKQANGATSDFIEVPDHAIRHKFLETGLKIKKHLVEVDLEDSNIVVKIINYASKKK